MAIVLGQGVDVEAQFDALPESNATWLVEQYDGPNIVALHEYFLPESGHDTLIDNLTFYELRVHSQAQIPIGALRDNELGLVYYHDYQSHQTQLLYNYEVSVSDTLTVYNWSFQFGPFTVSAVDTINLSGAARKRIGLIPNSNMFWIQGIGGTGGIISTCGPTISNWFDLKCMSWNDTIRYGLGAGSPGVCFVPQVVTDVYNPGSIIQATPNPSGGSFTLSEIPDEPAQVYDAQGRSILETSGREIYLTNYPAGIYLVRMTFNGQEYRVPLLKID